MAAGSFTLDLDRATPEEIKALTTRGFCRVVITPIWVDSNDIAAADLLGIAMYAGAYRKHSNDRTRWEGAGLAVMLGDEDGKANTYTTTNTVGSRPLYDGSNTSAIRNNVLRNGAGGANGITVGTIASSATPAKEFNIEVGDSPRDVLDFVCDLYTTSGSNPYEWKIDPRGRLSVALRHTLFPTTVTPTTLASRSTDIPGDVPTAIRVIPVDGFGPTEDVEDWTSTVFVTGPTVTLFGTEYTFTGSADIATNPYGDLAGDDLIMRRVITSNKSKSNTDNAAIADRALGKYDDVERHLSITTDLADVRSWLAPGDSMYVWDEEGNVFDLATQVDVGTVVHPLVTRVSGMQWPITDGMGVYCYSWNGSSFDMDDLTDFVVFDDGRARLDVGEPRRQLLGRRSRQWAA